MEVAQLIASLSNQIKYLASQKIRGLEKEDIQQELTVMVLEDVKKHPEFLNDQYEEGWWFKRLKWYLMNLREKEHRDPVNKSARYDSFNKDNTGKHGTK